MPAISDIEEPNKTLDTNQMNSVVNLTSEYINTSDEKIAVINTLEPSIDIKIENVNNEYNINTDKSPPETLVDNLELLNQ